MNSFAIYRLPHQQQCTLILQTSGTPLELSSLTELNQRSGFVVAPFAMDDSHPLLLIRPDEVKEASLDAFEKYGTFSEKVTHLLRESDALSSRECHTFSEARQSYHESFAHFHQRLVAGDFRKLVLSRCLSVPHSGDAAPFALFKTACSLYPRMFIALAYTPKSGLWLTATPEILLEGTSDRWCTIALAGTMKLDGDALMGEGAHSLWSTKNIEEQRVVASYIADRLKPFAQHVLEEGPRTVRAANLVHLRSDFTFTLLNNKGVGELLQTLHPTPAVCGLPKEQAFRFILDHEPVPRQYYSGFMGPLDILQSTHLYVSLRCMQITASQYRLYAGGGLLKDSVEEQEWLETEAKLETMRSLLNLKS